MYDTNNKHFANIETWRQLRDFLNTLTDETLDSKPILVIVEEEHVKEFTTIELAEEDYYYSEQLEDAGPIEVLRAHNIENVGQEQHGLEWPEIHNDLVPHVIKKGMAIIYADNLSEKESN